MNFNIDDLKQEFKQQKTNNDLRKDLNHYEQYVLNEHLMINETLAKQIDFQKQTCSKIEQVESNNKLIRDNLAKNDFDRTTLYQKITNLHLNSE